MGIELVLFIVYWFLRLVWKLNRFNKLILNDNVMVKVDLFFLLLKYYKFVKFIYLIL